MPRRPSPPRRAASLIPSPRRSGAHPRGPAGAQRPRQAALPHQRRTPPLPALRCQREKGGSPPREGEERAAHPAAQGRSARPGFSSTAVRYPRGPSCPAERFSFWQRRRAAASLRSTPRNSAGGGTHSPASTATAAILAATPREVREAGPSGRIHTVT